VSRVFRDAVLELAKRYPFARKLVNSGRLSVPAVLADSPLNTPDVDGDFAAHALSPGAPAADAPVSGAHGAWLLGCLSPGFTLLAFGEAIAPRDVDALAADPIPCAVVVVDGPSCPGAVGVEDAERLAAQRYDARAGSVYLLRPDQHLCARWRRFDVARVRAAIARATCN
jgi:3-(3-hydroxy-phenyl)propionate hydroxylase